MKILLKLLTIGLLAGLISCKDKDAQPREDQTLFLRHKGADMPIWVKGNAQAKKIVLFVHGGPGDCAMCYRYYLKDLEKDVMMAYWDQRVAGASSGKVDPATLRYAQFGEDMALTIRLLKKQYPDAQVYLLAHSFGVELAWQYLTTGNNQQQVAGAMMVNGMYSYYHWLYQVREWALNHAKEKGNKQAENFLTANPVTLQNTQTVDWEGIYRWMHKLNGNPISLYSDKKYLINYAFGSPNTALAQFTHSKAYGYYGDIESRTFEKGDLLKNVTIPIGLFWGAKDGIVPVEIGQQSRALLTNSQVTWTTFEESWHEPFITQTAEFADAVRSFVK